MTHYTIRPATLADLPTIVHHRRAMFTDMGLSGDYEAMDAHFGLWLQQAMASQSYWGWLVETEAGEIAAGGGVGLLPRPPSPQDFNEQWAFVYNVYTEPAHRRQPFTTMNSERVHAASSKSAGPAVAGHGRPAGAGVETIPGAGLSGRG